MEQIVYCADIIARFGSMDGPVVVVERLRFVKGLALPGGKQEEGETLSSTALREFKEETGLTLTLLGTLTTKAEAGRDPRGRYVSTVFLGLAHGVPRNEDGTTRVLFLTREEIVARKDEFVFDHYPLLAKHLMEVTHEDS
jgi:ADP-ribose pyrophosphatase YjhB (NUDIX family)